MSENVQLASVTRSEFGQFIGKFRMVCQEHQDLPLGNKAGRYRQDSFYRVLEFEGTKPIADKAYPLGIINYKPGSDPVYLINRNAE